MNNKIVIAIVAIALIGLLGFAYVQKKKGSYESTPSPASSGTVEETSTAPVTFTLSEVATHKDAGSCYTIISGSVYDLTEWIGRHPGGEDAILRMCGKDGTEGFMTQHGGGKRQADLLVTFKIGTLAQ